MASGFWNFWIFWVLRTSSAGTAQKALLAVSALLLVAIFSFTWPQVQERCKSHLNNFQPTDGHSRYEVMDMTLYLPTYTPCVCVCAKFVYIYNYIYVYVHMSNLLRVRARCLAIMISQKPRCGPALNI